MKISLLMFLFSCTVFYVVPVLAGYRSMGTINNVVQQPSIVAYYNENHQGVFCMRDCDFSPQQRVLWNNFLQQNGLDVDQVELPRAAIHNDSLRGISRLLSPEDAYEWLHGHRILQIQCPYSNVEIFCGSAITGTNSYAEILGR